MKPDFTSIVILAALFCTGASEARGEDCGQNELVRCANPLRVLTDNKELGFAAKKEDLDQLCPDLEAGLRCIDSYTRRCMTPEHRNHFNHLYAGTSMVIQELCREGPYQQEFLRHAPCMRQVKGDYEDCAKNYQHKIQQMANTKNDSTDGEAQVKTVCCSFQEYLTCSQSIVMRTCGEETARFTESFLDRMASSLIQIHCTNYSSDKCSDDSSAERSSSATLLLLLSACYLTAVWT